MAGYLRFTVVVSAVIMLVFFIFASNAFSTCGTCGKDEKVDTSAMDRRDVMPVVSEGFRSEGFLPEKRDDVKIDSQPKIVREPSVSEETDKQGNITKTYKDSEDRITRKEEVNKKEGTTATTDYDAEGRITRKEVKKKDGSSTITDYDATSGHPRSVLETHPNGRAKSDTRYDGRTGDKISERKFDEDSKLTSEETWRSDGTSQKREYKLDGGRIESDAFPDGTQTKTTYDSKGVVRGKYEINPRGTRIDRFREDKSRESITETTKEDGKTRYTKFDETGTRPTLEREIEQGMDTRKTYHGDDGSKNQFEYNADGSVRSQRRVSPDGREETTDYAPGKYFEADGKVEYNP